MIRSRSLASSTSGVAALEFALLAPFTVMFMLGVADFANGYGSGREVQMTAQTVSQLATSLAVTGDGSNVLTTANATSASEAAYVILRGVTDTNASVPFGIALSSIVMTKDIPTCTSSCTYSAHVAWSGNFGGSLGPSLVRPCDAVPGVSSIGSVADDIPPTNHTLPADAYSPSPILVVDVNYQFTPRFLGALGFTSPGASFIQAHSAYFSLRTGVNGAANNWLQYKPDAGESRVTYCPLYPTKS